MLRRLLIIPVVTILLASPAPAGFFSKKPKPNPAERVPELINTLKGSSDESKRQEAADELKQYDPNAFPQIMPALIEALTKDGSTAVRSEVASSIARMRPINQQAGYALEQAQNNDPSLRVRMSARQGLIQYNLVGYRGGKPPEQQPQDKAATPGTAPNAPAQPPQPAYGRANPHRGQFPETAEPPLADQPGPRTPAIPVSRPRQPATPPAVPPMQPLPGGPSAQPVELPGVPMVPPAAPAKPATNDGPALPSPF